MNYNYLLNNYIRLPYTPRGILCLEIFQKIDFYQETGCNHVLYVPSASDLSIYKPTHNKFSYKYDISSLSSIFENKLSFINSIPDYLN